MSAELRGPSEVMRRHYALGRDVPFALYADVEGLLKTEVFAALTPVLLSREEIVPTAEQRDCFKGLLGGMRELLLANEGQRHLSLMRFEPSAMSTPGKCLSLVFGLGHKSTTIDGADEAYEDEDDLLVTKAGLALHGTKDVVKAALAGNSDDCECPPKLELAENQYVSCRGTNGKDVNGGCALTVTPEYFGFKIGIDYPDEESAKISVRAIDRLLEAGGAKGALPGLSYGQKASRFEVALEARGGAVDQARQIGVLTALLVHSVKKFLLSTKQMEVRQTLPAIAMGYEANSTKRLQSFPAVPPTIPRGARYMSKQEEWKAWEPIGHHALAPQWYQYEIVAAPDGKSAEIIARGDLDGDGKASKFVLRVRLEKDGPKSDRQIEETDPEE